MKWMIVLISMIFPCLVSASELILKEESFGRLNLNKETKISLVILKQYFPQYTITHGVGQGDSPDFHYFDAKDSHSNIIFRAFSFIEDESDRDKATVKLDLLEIYSPHIEDEYGLKTGMLLNDIIRKRAKNLIFGANHHDNHIGQGNIWYALSTDKFADHDGPDINPENISFEEAKRKNPRITTISWPYPRW